MTLLTVKRPGRVVKGLITVAVGSLLAVGAAVTTTAAPAAASDDWAKIETTQILSKRPTNAMQGKCVWRTIYLQTGDYHWWSYLDTPRNEWDGRADRDIRLNAGTYTWRTCIEPHNGRYRIGTTIRSSSGSTAALAANAYMNYNGTVTARWGSGLELR